MVQASLQRTKVGALRTGPVHLRLRGASLRPLTLYPEYGHRPGSLSRAQVVVRRLPPGLTEDGFKSALDKVAEGQYTWFSYHQGKVRYVHKARQRTGHRRNTRARSAGGRAVHAQSAIPKASPRGLSVPSPAACSPA